MISPLSLSTKKYSEYTLTSLPPKPSNLGVLSYDLELTMTQIKDKNIIQWRRYLVLVVSQKSKPQIENKNLK